VKNVYIILQQIYSRNSTKYHQNRPSFTADITKKHYGLLFSGHSV